MGRLKPGSTTTRVVIVDNYDSFTYNTLQLLGGLGAECRVVLNDAVTTADIEACEPMGILLSAGPGTPDEAGITLETIRHFAGRVPVLGVCLGHQAIAQAFGGRVVGGGRMMHGKTCVVEHDGLGLFEGLPHPVNMARYNSLLVDGAHIPPELRVTARSTFDEVMGLEHRQLPIRGVQFHPESILSESGGKLFANWLKELVSWRDNPGHPSGS